MRSIWFDFLFRHLNKSEHDPGVWLCPPQTTPPTSSHHCERILPEHSQQQWRASSNGNVSRADPKRNTINTEKVPTAYLLKSLNRLSSTEKQNAKKNIFWDTNTTKMIVDKQEIVMWGHGRFTPSQFQDVTSASCVAAPCVAQPLLGPLQSCLKQHADD